MYNLYNMNEVHKMDKNENISCVVTNCKHHNPEFQCCSLPRIQVTKHGLENSIESTDCANFEEK